MKNNITLYIGKNASGKTRILYDIALKSNNVVTNLKNTGLPEKHGIDNNKIERLKKVQPRFYELFTENDNYLDLYSSMLKQFIKLLISNGDTLVIDDVDSIVCNLDLLDICEAISTLRDFWKEIYISGYNIKLMRVFTYTDLEDYSQKEMVNLVYVYDNMKTLNLKEDNCCEYFDKIRG